MVNARFNCRVWLLVSVCRSLPAMATLTQIQKLPATFHEAKIVSGGYKYCKAIGVMLEGRNIASFYLAGQLGNLCIKRRSKPFVSALRVR